MTGRLGTGVLNRDRRRAQCGPELVERLVVIGVADLDDPAGSAARIASWARPNVTRAAIERAGLTWDHEVKQLERVYRDLGVIP